MIACAAPAKGSGGLVQGHGVVDLDAGKEVEVATVHPPIAGYWWSGQTGGIGGSCIVVWIGEQRRRIEWPVRVGRR